MLKPFYFSFTHYFENHISFTKLM